jgi:hypothetical protein
MKNTVKCFILEYFMLSAAALALNTQNERMAF